MELIPGEEILVKTRPAWRSFWVFFLGILLTGVGPFLKDDPPLNPTTGVIFAAILALIILRRWSDVYILTNLRVMVRGGLIERGTSEINLADVTSVETFQGINLRLVKAGHVLVRSSDPHQENIMMYGQANSEAFKTRIESLAAQVQGKNSEQVTSDSEPDNNGQLKPPSDE